MTGVYLMFLSITPSFSIAWKGAKEERKKSPGLKGHQGHQTRGTEQSSNWGLSMSWKSALELPLKLGFLYCFLVP